MLRIAVLGAPRTGKTRLAAELALALAQRPVSVSDGAALLTAITDRGRAPPTQEEVSALAQTHGRLYELTLLLGLDLLPPAEARASEAVDMALRDALLGASLAYKVIYGQGAQRLQNALLAIEGTGAAPPDARLATQYGLQGGRVAWRCENCSDPTCEHRLFTGLLP
ncbi:hypothetical protein [Ramlibacter sp. 2FC]|uniref:hypothetical protein n=1 Tax=Ramlibacter sp. 2FC TaxID=2502188 RepID=UPI0010F8D618|nr:hypothetical protein [Ramlibacter sp. 2FC]